MHISYQTAYHTLKNSLVILAPEDHHEVCCSFTITTMKLIEEMIKYCILTIINSNGESCVIWNLFNVMKPHTWSATESCEY